MNAQIAPQMDLDFTRRPRRNRVSYFNTTGLAGRDLSDAKGNARKQDVLVLTIFRGHNTPMTPRQVWRIGLENGSDWELTSVRRSMHTLTAEGLLTKTETLREGAKGRPEHVWALKEQEPRT